MLVAIFEVFDLDPKNALQIITTSSQSSKKEYGKCFSFIQGKCLFR